MTASRKAHDAQVTQVAILDAAEAEFAKQGFAAARTEEIATHSGVTKTMIYYYFENKEGLYLAMLKRTFGELMCLHSIQEMKLEQLPPEQALERFLQRFLSKISRNPNLPAILLYESLQNKGKYYKEIGIISVYKVLIAILEQGMASGVFRPLEPQHTAVNIVGTCVFYFCAQENIKYLWQDLDLLSKEMLEQHTQEAIKLMLAGVRRPT